MQAKAVIFRKKEKGRQVDLSTLKELKRLLKDKDFSRDMLIEHLHVIQDNYGYIDDKNIVALAAIMKITPVEVYEVASFYHHFDIVKDNQAVPPKITVRVCESMSCKMFGSDKLIRELNDSYKGKVRIQNVPCVGACHEAPIAVVGKKKISHASKKIINKYVIKNDTEAQEVTNYVSYYKYIENNGYQILKDIYLGSKNKKNIIDILKDSNIRGLGGAGFPTGLKWEIVSKEKAPRFLVVNIDEGEPGTIKDSIYLSTKPHQFLEGMLIAAKTVDCIACYIYIRDEYPSQYELLIKEINTLKDNICLDIPPIYLRRGAGAYICGEESALIESIEGKRGMPRLRPPFVASRGLFNRPTLVNNLETLYWVPIILKKGGANWFKNNGANNRTGLRSYSISGRIKKPGLHLAPAGTTVQDLIDNYCGGMLDGHKLYGYFPGGASGGILPAYLNKIPLDFDTLNEYGCFIGSAAVIIFSDKDSAKDMAINAMNFFKKESCGQCTPCSVGTDKVCNLINKDNWDINLIKDLSNVMSDASICGLGQAAPNPIMSIIKYFPQEINDGEII